MKEKHAASYFLASLGKKYPTAWREADRIRAMRSKDMPAWPPSVFMPFQSWVKLSPIFFGVSRPAPEQIYELQMLAMAAAWRPGQDIVRLDRDIYEAVCSTSISGALPADMLMRLPAWAIYFETAGLNVAGMEWQGFFARLDIGANGEDVLRLYLLGHDTQIEFPLALGNWTLEEAFERTVIGARQILSRSAALDLSYGGLGLEEGLQKAVNLVLYVCAYGFGDRERQQAEVKYPTPHKVKTGWRLFPPDHPTVHVLGESFGKQIRANGNKQERESTRGHASPRPHIRRAHWHSFWAGPMNGERKLCVRWLPPMAVAMKDEE